MGLRVIASRGQSFSLGSPWASTALVMLKYAGQILQRPHLEYSLTARTADSATTERLCSLGEGDALTDVVGPLGKATEIENFGHVVLVGGGVGTAVIYPQAAALKAKGNRVTSIMGGRSKPYVILEEELKAICDAVYPCTDDGSYGYNGFVTGKLGELIADPALPVNAVITAGPVPMMKAIANVTRER